MPVQHLPGGLFPVIDRVVAHLAVGDGLVDLPPAVHLAIQIALGLDAGGVVGVDQADLAGAAHAAGDHVLADDIGNIQQVNGLELCPYPALPASGGCDHLMDLADHSHHAAIAAGGAAEGAQPLALRADGVVHHNQAGDAPILPVGDQIKVMAQRLGPSFFGIADSQRGGVLAEGQVRVLQPLGHGARVIRLVQDLQVRAHGGQLVGIVLQHPHAHAAAHHQQVEQVVIGRKAVDDGECAVVVGHGVLLGHRGAAHPQGAAG